MCQPGLVFWEAHPDFGQSRFDPIAVDLIQGEDPDGLPLFVNFDSVESVMIPNLNIVVDFDDQSSSDVHNFLFACGAQALCDVVPHVFQYNRGV